MANDLEQMRDAITADIPSEVDSSPSISDNSGVETESATGSAPSQNELTSNEIPENFRKEYGIPDTYRTLGDMFKGYKELNSFRGRQSNEIGQMNQQIEQLRQALGQKMAAIESRMAPGEDINAKYLEMLQNQPVDGIRNITKDLVAKEMLAPIQQQIAELNQWKNQQAITTMGDKFVRDHNISKEQETALANIINENADFYRNLPMEHVLRVARAELLDRQNAGDAVKNNAAAQVAAEKEKKAQVLSTTNSRPQKTTPKNTDELRAAAMAELGL